MVAQVNIASNVQSLGNTNAPIRLAANQITQQLLAAEAAIDAAVAAVATLAATMPLATQQANVGTHVLQESLMHAMETCQQLVKARTNILRTHRSLTTASQGFSPMAFGDITPCLNAELAPERTLTAVAA